MSILVWTANHALWISLIGALCAVVVGFEKLLPKRLHKYLLAISLFVGLATPLLGLLKKSLDDQWKIEMQKQVSAAIETARPKPFKNRLIFCLNSIDPRIMTALAAGQTHFPCQLKPSQFADLQKLAAESEASAYISFRAENAFTVDDRGAINYASIDLKPLLLKE
jgi:hypothetical protein